MNKFKRPVEKIVWQEHILDEMNSKTIKPYKRCIGIAFDQDNIEFVNRLRGKITFSEYINGVVTALREYHEEGKMKK